MHWSSNDGESITLSSCLINVLTPSKDPSYIGIRRDERKGNPFGENRLLETSLCRASHLCPLPVSHCLLPGRQEQTALLPVTRVLLPCLRLQTMEPANQRLKLWIQINLSSLKLFLWLFITVAKSTAGQQLSPGMLWRLNEILGGRCLQSHLRRVRAC